MFVEMYKNCLKERSGPRGLLACINFIKENLTLDELRENLSEIQDFMSLLGLNYEKVSYYIKSNKLLDDERWNDLSEDFKSVYFSSSNVKSNSSLEFFFYCGLLALKTSSCGSRKSESSFCPICNSDLSNFAKCLPTTQHAVTTLLCKKTRLIMDSTNPPLCTTKGHLFSSSYVQNELLIKDEIYCEEDKKLYKLPDFKKVFIV